MKITLSMDVLGVLVAVEVPRNRVVSERDVLERDLDRAIGTLNIGVEKVYEATRGPQPRLRGVSHLRKARARAIEQGTGE